MELMIRCEMMRLATLVILPLASTIAKHNCPALCHCSQYVVNCSGRGLKSIPEVLPLTARRIDLSNNPSLQISRDYFLQFQYLFILLLSNCNLEGPIYLPNTIRDVKLDNNAFRVMALKQMLSNSTKSLMRISLQNNGLQTPDVKQVLKLLPANLEEINFNSNNVTILTKNDFGRFNNLKTIKLHNCSLRSIDAKVFENMAQLSQVWIDDGELQHLPDGLFRYNGKLKYLNVAGNKLTTFNASKLGLKMVHELDLGYNMIRIIDVKTLTTRKFWLNRNRMKRLPAQLFKNNSFLSIIILSNNNLHSISPHTFKGIKHIGVLSMKFNNLTSLPQDIFKDKTIMKILLQRNMLVDITGIFDRLNPCIYLIDLTENKHLRNINGSDLAQIDSMSTIYLTCKDLAKISNLSRIRAKILCSPKADLVVQAKNTNGLSGQGYACAYNERRLVYTCRACKQGYFSSYRNIRKATSNCIQCPPGSYYQDEPASIMCKTCRPGQFVPPEHSPGRDASDCETCPQGTNTNIIAGTRACTCLRGYSRRYRFGACAKCTDDGFNCSQDYQVLQDGYWMTWQGTVPEYKINMEARNATQRACEPVYKAYIRNLDTTDDSYDRATMHFNCQMPLPIPCPMLKSCVGGIQPKCSTEYTGALCAVCKLGYTRQFNQCVRCPTRVWAVVQYIGFIASFAIFCFIISVADSSSYGNMKHSQQTQVTYNRKFVDVLLSSLKILMGFYQVLFTIMHAFSSVYWSENVKIATGILQYLQFQIIRRPSLHCIRPEWKIDAFTELWLILITIAGISFLIVVYYFTKSLYIYYQYQCSSAFEVEKRRYVCGRNCISFVALLLFVTYIFISKKIIEILPISCHSFCTARQNDKCVHSMSFLRSDYSTPCPTMDDNKTIVIIGYTVLILPLGMPILLFMALRTFAPKLKAKVCNGSHDLHSSQVPRSDEDKAESLTQFDLYFSSIKGEPLFGDSFPPMMTSALKFIYENYHSRYWYWEVIEMIRKFLMIIGIVLSVGHTKIGLACTIIVAMVFIILHAVVKPFKNTFESRAQLLSLILIPINLAFGAVLQSRYKGRPNIMKSEMDSFSLSVLYVAMNSSLFIIMFANITFLLAKTISSGLRKSG